MSKSGEEVNDQGKTSDCIKIKHAGGTMNQGEITR